MSRTTKVVPPFRFATVEVGVYRGAYPTLKNFSFLKSLGLRTIISLIPEQPTEDLSDFCVSENIEHFHKMVEKRKEDVTVSIKDVAEVVSKIIRSSKLPVYVHCLDGSDTTGLVMCCLRRLQAWHPECVVNEFCRFSRSGEMSKDEEKFVKSFNEVEITEDDPPEWLWKAKLPVEPHPSIKLIKHTEGGAVQVVPPASKPPSRKETKQMSNSLPLSAVAMKRTKKNLNASAPALARRADELVLEGSVEEEGSLARLAQSRERPSHRDSALLSAGAFRVDAAPGTGSPDGSASARKLEEEDDEEDEEEEEAEEEEEEEDPLVSYPSLLEALSLHKFSDLSAHAAKARSREGI